ncbi:MAG: hypothetical protein ABIA56_02620 [Actinomycetota bacterium]
MEIINEKENRNTKGSNKDFPLTKLGVAEEVLPHVEKAGGKMNSKTLSEALDIRGGAFARKLSSIKRWGLVTGSGMLTLTELGNSILHPISEEELAENRKNAFIQIQLFKELYERFNLNLPEDKTFIAILIREYNVKKFDAKTILNIYKNSIKEFLSIAKKENPKKWEIKIEKANRIINNEVNNRKISVIINSPMGENNFKADNKEELEIMKKRLNSLFNLIEDELSEKQDNNHTGLPAERSKPDLSSEVSGDSSELAN